LKYLLYIAIFSTTLPLVFYLLFKRNDKKNSLRVILFYVLYCIFNEGMSFYLQSIQSEAFLILFYSFTIIEYSFFCLFIYLVVPKGLLKNLIPVLWFGFIAFEFIDLVFINKGKGFDSIATGIEYIIIIFLCVCYLFVQLRKANNLLIYSTFDFWVIITFLIYFSGTFFLYIMAEGLRHSLIFRQQYTIINASFNILKNILLCVAMTMKLNNEATSQKSHIPDLDDNSFIPENVNFPN